MRVRIFLAGATGAVGRALAPLLVQAGYEVHGSTRQPARAGVLEAMGVAPVVVDVYDAAQLTREMQRIRPTIVVHQLTDLPAALDPAQMALPGAGERNARVRTEGTRNLAAAALAGGASRMLSQSIAWAYAPGAQPYGEEQPLDVEAQGARRTTVQGIVTLEDITLNTTGLSGTVLRYGYLYGPGTGFEGKRGASPLHLEAAATGAFLALQRACGGVFNFAEDGAEVSNAKARRDLGWRPEMRVADFPARRAA